MYISLADVLANGTGTERPFTCPVHDDTDPSASVNVVKGLWVCYACGAGGRIDEDYEPDDAVWAKEIRRRLSKTVTHHPESWLSVFTAGGPGEYWLSRFSQAACEEFQLGVTPDALWATYPLREASGALLGVVGRTLVDDPRKYLYPYGVDVTEHLFNYDRCTDDVLVLTEGATDTIAAWEAGWDAMAVFGSRMSRHQLRLIQRYAPSEVILAFDQDTAGTNAASVWRQGLEEIGIPSHRPRWSGYKDLASMPRKIITRSLQNLHTPAA